MNKVLVTGGNGFLGSNLVRELYRQGYDVRVMVRHTANLAGIQDVPCETVYGDICDAADVQKAIAGCHIVVHAACITAQWAISFHDYERVNFLATKLIADACLQQQVARFIYVSTANTIGPGSLQRPATELSSFSLYHLNSGYISTKYLAQQYVLEQVERKQLPAIIVNPTFMIGPNDIKPSSGKLLLYGLRKRLLFYPPGGKNFVYIRDVCRGVIGAIQRGKPGECYLLAGQNLTYKQFFTLVNEVSNERRLMIKIPAILLRTVGLINSLLGFFIGRHMRFDRTAAHLVCQDNYYSGKKSERELLLSYTPVKTAVAKALTWFKEHDYV